jgi:DNA topoisomerase IB
MHVNDYIREISGEEFTAKDFRTWNGTVLAVEALLKLSAETTQKKLKRNVVAAVAEVAEQLGNTPDGLPQELYPSRGARCVHGAVAWQGFETFEPYVGTLAA